MGRACLSEKIIGKKAFDKCKCKERAGTFFKAINRTLETQAKNACNGENPEALQTPADFAEAMNLTEAEILSRYGYDINKENGLQTADVKAGNQKAVYFMMLIVVVLIIYYLSTKK